MRSLVGGFQKAFVNPSQVGDLAAVKLELGGPFRTSVNSSDYDVMGNLTHGGVENLSPHLSIRIRRNLQTTRLVFG